MPIRWARVFFPAMFFSQGKFVRHRSLPESNFPFYWRQTAARS